MISGDRVQNDVGDFRCGGHFHEREPRSNFEFCGDLSRSKYSVGGEILAAMDLLY